MRELKFRAWLKEEKRMLDKVALTWPGSEMIIQWYDSLDDYYAGALSDCAERDVVVMQYTGLKDKNGKEIYEGDITVSFKNKYENFPTTNKVQFIRGCWRLKAGWMNDVPLYNYDASELEVIGNIYENPELLEDTHE